MRAFEGRAPGVIALDWGACERGVVAPLALPAEEEDGCRGSLVEVDRSRRVLLREPSDACRVSPVWPCVIRGCPVAADGVVDVSSTINHERNETGILDLTATEEADDAADGDVMSIIQRNASKKRTRTEFEGELSLEQFRSSPTYCRIPASSVAALCGLNPFSNLPQLLFDLVYQTYLGQLLLQMDATALGLQVVGAEYERESMLKTASAASNETKDLVKSALELSDGKRKVDSLEEVQSLQKKIEVQATKAHAAGKLSKKQVANLVDQTRGHISTGFGTSHEDEALDIYEKRMGCTVRERNECFFEWRFRRRDAENPNGVTAEPIGDATRKASQRLAPAEQEGGVKEETKPVGGAEGEREKPFFRIVSVIADGSGLSYQD